MILTSGRDFACSFDVKKKGRREIVDHIEVVRKFRINHLSSVTDLSLAVTRDVSTKREER